MSEHKQALTSTKSVENNSIGPKSRKRTYILAAVGTLLIGICAAGTYYLSSTKQAPKPAATPQLTPQEKTNYQALGQQIKGDSSAAQKTLDDAIANATSPADKASFYMQKANLACATNDYTNGLTFAKKAEELKSSTATASVLALCAEKQGDTKAAISYYKLQLQRIGKPTVRGDDDELRAKITKLEGALQQ